MSQARGSGGGAASTLEYRSRLLGRLGLDDKAGDQDIESTYREVLDFLDSAPHSIAPWASAQRDGADEAFALLASSEEDLAQLSSAASDDEDEAPTGTRPARPARAARATGAAPARAAKPARPADPVEAGAPQRGRRHLLAWVLAPLVVVAVVVGVYLSGKGSAVPGINGTPTSTASSTTATIDQAQVAALMQKIAADPKDVVSLQALGDQYFQGGDYKTAASWETKVLALDPTNQTALLALGAAQFNQGNSADAKATWLKAEKLYPNVAEVHYDLGFLYMSQQPADTAKMRAEWQKVVDIDPNSDLAKTVATHLSSSTPSPSPSN